VFEQLMLCFVVLSHALAVVVEVNEGETSVLLPCQHSSIIPDDLTVMWSRCDLHPKSVHLQQEKRDNLTGQNQHYRGRCPMKTDALETGDISLTLTDLQLSDSATYTCSVKDTMIGQRRVTDVQLEVKGQQQTPAVGLLCHYRQYFMSGECLLLHNP
uniref:Ig-like domain-containing protein n=1 Tax=Oreochromis niloticus TaxID=8128 RepID=A0A669DLN6_ORENI